MSLEEPPHTVSIAVPALVLALLVPTLLLGWQPRVAHRQGVEEGGNFSGLQTAGFTGGTVEICFKGQ